MREKNRKPIASYIKLPQFTTMNVIDGQAGLIIYASLIFYSLTIDNILNIIVLLILAGVTIATLTGDNGLLTKAGNSKNAQTEAEVEEQIKLAHLEFEMQKFEHNAESNEENFLHSKLDPVYGIDNVLIVNQVPMKVFVTIAEKTYGVIIETNGNIQKTKFEPLIQDKTNITDIKTGKTYEVGDTVLYDCGVGNYTGKWGILGVENGKLLLMSTVNISNVALDGKNNYLTEGSTKLNNACIPYKNETYADSVRSVNVEDINRITGYEPLNPQSYTYTMVDGYVKRNDSNPSTWVQKFEDVYSKKLPDNSPISVIHNSYEYNLTNNLSSNSKAYKLINISGKNLYYWLDSKMLSSSEGYASWGFRIIGNGDVSWIGVWNSSYGTSSNSTFFGVRAVIILKENIQLKWNPTTEVWEF